MEQAVPTTSTVGQVQKKKNKKYNWKKSWPLIVMMVPGLLYLLINNYLPMFGIFIAFKNINFAKGIFNSDWVGFKNFEYLFSTADAYIITRNTILYNIVFIVLGTILALACAILLNEIKNKFAMRFYQAVIAMPNLISWVIISYLVFAFLGAETGYVNNTILPLLGSDDWIMFYLEPKYWPYILTTVHFWKSVGFSSIIYFASLMGIDNSYYEAARLDGASRWKQITRITIPIMMPVIIMLFIMSIGRIFYSDFGLFYQATNNSGALFQATGTIDTYVFNGLLGVGDIGMSAAAGFYQSVVGFILILVANYITRLISRENAIF
jgi:putative aldouronate transport system permease protein